MTPAQVLDRALPWHARVCDGCPDTFQRRPGFLYDATSHRLHCRVSRITLRELWRGDWILDATDRWLADMHQPYVRGPHEPCRACHETWPCEPLTDAVGRIIERAEARMKGDA